MSLIDAALIGKKAILLDHRTESDDDIPSTRSSLCLRPFNFITFWLTGVRLKLHFYFVMQNNRSYKALDCLHFLNALNRPVNQTSEGIKCVGVANNYFLFGLHIR